MAWTVHRSVMEVLVLEFESRTDVSFLVIKAYILSFFFLFVVLFLAVGDTWTQFAKFYSLSSFSSNYAYHYLDFSLTLWTPVFFVAFHSLPRVPSVLKPFEIFACWLVEMEPPSFEIKSKFSLFSGSLRSSPFLSDFMTSLIVPFSCGLFNCSVSVDWYMITSLPSACSKDVQRRQDSFLSSLPEVCTLQPPSPWRGPLKVNLSEVKWPTPWVWVASQRFSRRGTLEFQILAQAPSDSSRNEDPADCVKTGHRTFSWLGFQTEP